VSEELGSRERAIGGVAIKEGKREGDKVERSTSESKQKGIDGKGLNMEGNTFSCVFQEVRRRDSQRGSGETISGYYLSKASGKKDRWSRFQLLTSVRNGVELGSRLIRPPKPLIVADRFQCGKRLNTPRSDNGRQ
jgi:hypothetical protein